MPAWIAIALQVFQGILKEAPDIAKAYESIVGFIKSLFGSGVITKGQQDYLMGNVDGFLAGFKPGAVPSQWTVEPDPPSV